MPRPKKSDRTKKKEEALHDIQQDHEQFLLAFEKPTQIYRFLRARQIISPTFMNRTLLYMHDRCSRTNARRGVFSLKDLLPAAHSDENCLERIDGDNAEDLHISLTCVSMDMSKHGDRTKLPSKKFRRMDIEVLLSKSILKKRKDNDFASSEVSAGVVEVPVNRKITNESSAYSLVNTEGDIVIPASDFAKYGVDGSTVKSYSLLFRVREACSDSDDSEESDSEESDDGSESEQEDDLQRMRKKKKSDEGEEDDPAGISLKNLTTGPRKRRARSGYKRDEKRKSIKSASKRDEDTGNSAKIEPKIKIHSYGSTKPSVLKRNPSTASPVLYEAELLISNNDRECQARDGDYELVLTKNEVDKPEEYKRKAVWESFNGGSEIKVYSAFNGPCLKLRVRWRPSNNPGPLADHKEDEETKRHSKMEVARRRTRTAALTSRHGKLGYSNEDCNDGFQMEADKVEYRKAKLCQKGKQVNNTLNGCDHGGLNNGKVYYQFMYNNNTQQQTESRDDFFCPWCQLNCMALYGLMKHLKLCHPRFLFRYSQQPRGTNIIVTVNECYDGSYAGNPHNIFGQPGLAFSRRGPVRRIPITDILVYKPQRSRRIMKSTSNLSELLEKEDVEALEAAQFSTGHRRLYFHSATVLPIRPCEFDVDSDGEAEEPDWLFGHTKRMIDEFTDVNEGEKALMKLWNLHIMRHNCISDSQIENECKRFIEKNIAQLSIHGLRRNLLLHFLCLVDFGVFKTSSVISLMEHFDEVENQHKLCSSAATDNVEDLMSANFPEPDLMPRIEQLQEILGAQT